MVNELHDLIRISCEEMENDDFIAAEYEQWLEREREWERTMAYADTVGA